jgi:hypothetical protein
VTSVTAALAGANAAVPGPVSLLHVIVTGPGKPSSVTVPTRCVAGESGLVTSGPALTTGGWSTACTVTTTVSLTVNWPSFALSCSV